MSTPNGMINVNRMLMKTTPFRNSMFIYQLLPHCAVYTKRYCVAVHFLQTNLPQALHDFASNWLQSVIAFTHLQSSDYCMEAVLYAGTILLFM